MWLKPHSWGGVYFLGFCIELSCFKISLTLGRQYGLGYQIISITEYWYSYTLVLTICLSMRFLGIHDFCSDWHVCSYHNDWHVIYANLLLTMLTTVRETGLLQLVAPWDHASGIILPLQLFPPSISATTWSLLPLFTVCAPSQVEQCQQGAGARAEVLLQPPRLHKCR